jgi:hypothetical protein
MKLIWIKLSAFVLIGLGAAIYLWWHFSNEQAVLRRTDAFLETATVQRLSLGDSEKPLQIFRSIISDPFTLAGSHPVPSGIYSEDEAVGHLREFRDSVGGSRIRRLETAVTFPSAEVAEVVALIELDLSWGRGARSVDKYKAKLIFEASPEGWILTQGTFIQRAGK